MLEVVGLGDVPRTILDAASTAPAAAFCLTLKSIPALAEPRYAHNPSRGQHHGAAILRKLAGARTTQDGLVLGVGLLDLFVPDVPYVLGDWDRDAGAAVVGVRRLLAAAPDVVARRVGTVGIWAVGRVLGLPDCEDARCPMGYPELERLDHRQAVPCNRCQNTLNTARERLA